MYPYERMNPIRSVLEKPKIFLWLLRQNFNVMELLTEESIPTRNMGCKIKAAGYVLADTCISHGCELLRDDNGDIIVYSNDQAHDAIVKKQQLDETNEYNDYKVYALVEVKETEKHQYKRKNNNKK